jgi:hypothetical protein
MFIVIRLIRNIKKFHTRFLQSLATLLLVTDLASSDNIGPFIDTTQEPGVDVITAQVNTVKVSSAISTRVAVTSEQSPVRQYNLVMLIEVKTMTPDSDDARSF